jgi:chromatin segregation and condensation protein Rec8/ScpA/Scc1 (kleisin family)
MSQQQPSTIVMRRPFYLRPPWNILFELSKLEKLTPWSVNIAYLLRTFLTEMEKANAEKVDFRASGVALDSSALIYLMKSKLLLTLQEPPAAPARVPTDFVPPPLFLPLRHELTSTTIQHLLEVLEDVLKGEKYLSLGHEIEQHPILPAVTDLMPKFDKFIAELENEVDKLFNILMERTGGQGIIDFTTLVKGKTRIEALRTFIYLLFLAQDGLVTLWQNEETEELYIAVGKINVAKPTA